MKTIVEIEWDPKYVAYAELAELARRMRQVILTNFFTENLPPWATVNSRVEDA